MTTETLITNATQKRKKRRGPVRSSGVAPVRGLLPAVVFLLAWQFIPMDESTEVNFPRPTAWVARLGQLAAEGHLWDALGRTVYVFLVAVVLATVLGAVLGMALGMSHRLSRALSPLLEFMRALPPPAVVPIAILLVGATDGMVISVVVFTAFWPIVFNATAAFGAIPQVRMDMSRTLGLGTFAQLRKVILPSLVPAIALGVRVSLPQCLILTLVSEIVASKPGLGHLLLLEQRAYNAASGFGLLLLIAVIAYLLTIVVSMMEARVLRNWPEGV